MTRPELPHAEAIREARAEVNACQEALILNQHLQTARTALSILEVQRATGMTLPPELPGEDVVTTAVTRFPNLRDLPSIFPLQADSATQLRSRNQQLDLVAATLQPMLTQNEEAAERLHTLQHHQHHALEQPEWADVVQQLAQLGETRDRLALQMAPLQHQIALVDPVQEMLAGFHPHLQSELVTAARTEDPHGVVAWRSAVMAHQQLVGLANVIEQLGLVVQYPFEPMLPDDPHPRHRRRLRKEAGGVLEWMGNLSEALATHRTVLADRMAALKTDHDAAEHALQEWMG